MTTPHDNPDADTHRVLLTGLGHAGIKAVQTAVRQFDSPHYDFLGVDTPNSLINLDDKDLPTMAMQEGWEQSLTEPLAGHDMIVLLMGLGGRTAPEAAKAMAKAATLLNIPLIVLATMPFSFEGEQRKVAANKALTALRPHVNSVIVLPNDVLFSPETISPSTDAIAAFERVDEWITEVASSLLKPFTFENIFNVNPDNLEWLLKRKNSTCSVGIGWGEGEDAVVDAVTQLSQSPFLRLLPDATQADAAMVMVSLPEGTTITQVTGCLEAVKRLFSPHLKLEIGACIDDSIAEGVRIVTLMRFPTRQLPQTYANATPEERAELQQDSQRNADQPADATDASYTQSAFGLTGQLPATQQLMLPITEYKTGIFSQTTPTKYHFENLDVPTFLRRKIRLD